MLLYDPICNYDAKFLPKLVGIARLLLADPFHGLIFIMIAQTQHGTRQLQFSLADGVHSFWTTKFYLHANAESTTSHRCVDREDLLPIKLNLRCLGGGGFVGGRAH